MESYIQNIQQMLRRRIIKLMFYFVWLFLILDILFFFFYQINHSMFLASKKLYLFKRILLPFCVNFLSFLTARAVELKESLRNETKNRVCAFAMLTLSGSMAVFHSFFTSLWCGPLICITYCSVFNDKKLQRKLFLYSDFIILAATCYIVQERPGEAVKYYQMAAVTLALSHCMNYVVNALQKYQEAILQKTNETYEEKLKYEKRLKYDYLTGIFSKEHLILSAMQSFEGNENGRRLAVAMVDVDDFKKINDTYGHENGDIVLRKLGELLQGYMSEDTIIGRFGGEEFVVVFQNGSYEKYEAVMRELLLQFEEIKYEFTDQRITFSCGMAYGNAGSRFEEVLGQADQALYQAKQAGKDRVCWFMAKL